MIERRLSWWQQASITYEYYETISAGIENKPYLLARERPRF